MTDSFNEQVARLRRKQILDAAIAVFAERGFHRTTIRDVAKAAGVADGTIYNYFANKTALLLAILDPFNEREQPPELRLPSASTDVHAFFRTFFAQRIQAFDGDNLAVIRVVLSEVLSNPDLRERFVEQVIAPAYLLAEPVLHHFIALGKLRPVDVPLTLRSMTATFLGLLMLRLMGDELLAAQWGDLPDLLTTALLNGLLPDAGAGPAPT